MNHGSTDGRRVHLRKRPRWPAARAAGIGQEETRPGTEHAVANNLEDSACSTGRAVQLVPRRCYH